MRLAMGQRFSRQSARQLPTIPDECAYRVRIRLVLDYSRPPATSKRGKRIYPIQLYQIYPVLDY